MLPIRVFAAEEGFKPTLKTLRPNLGSPSETPGIVSDSVQGISLKYANPKAKKAYEKGMNQINNDQTEKAIQSFERAISLQPAFVDPYILLGDIAWKSKQWEVATEKYERALNLMPDYKVGVRYRLAYAYNQLFEYEKAAFQYEHYLASPKVRGRDSINCVRLLANAQFAANAVQNPLPFDPENLGDSINGPESEYLPSFRADGELFIYTTRVGGTNEEFFISQQDSGSWRKALNMGPPVNTPGNEGAHNLSFDGKTLLFTACNREDGLGSCDIYISRLEKGRWSDPVNMGFPINSPYWDTQPSLSANGKSLYFCSNRPGGKGEKDLWVSHLTGGGWSAPINLETLNTPYTEQTPFMHADGKTLYFSSDGWPGMGNTDLFLTKMNLDGMFDPPVNLGYPINSPEHEGSLVVSTDGQSAYYASDRTDSRGLLDLYTFELPVSIRPDVVTYIKGRVTDAANGLPLQATVQLSSLPGGEMVFQERCGTEGEYLVCLRAGTDYMLHVSVPGYFFHSENFTLQASNSANPHMLDVELQKIGTVGEVVLRNIFFHSGSAQLDSASYPELQAVRNLLDRHPGIRIQINGYTDDVGREQDNLVLSEKRAEAVLNALLRLGVDAGRLEWKGWGETKPLLPNINAENRAGNRRISFEVLD